MHEQTDMNWFCKLEQKCNNFQINFEQFRELEQEFLRTYFSNLFPQQFKLKKAIKLQ